MRDILINFRASREYREFLKKRAEEEKLSLSKFIEKCVNLYIIEHDRANLPKR